MLWVLVGGLVGTIWWLCYKLGQSYVLVQLLAGDCDKKRQAIEDLLKSHFDSDHACPNVSAVRVAADLPATGPYPWEIESEASALLN